MSKKRRTTVVAQSNPRPPRKPPKASPPPEVPDDLQVTVGSKVLALFMDDDSHVYVWRRATVEQMPANAEERMQSKSGQLFNNHKPPRTRSTNTVRLRWECDGCDSPADLIPSNFRGKWHDIHVDSSESRIPSEGCDNGQPLWTWDPSARPIASPGPSIIIAPPGPSIVAPPGPSIVASPGPSIVAPPKVAPTICMMSMLLGLPPPPPKGRAPVTARPDPSRMATTNMVPGMLFRIPRSRSFDAVDRSLPRKIRGEIEGTGFGGVVPEFVEYFQAMVEERWDNSSDYWRVTVFGIDSPFQMRDIEIVLSDTEINCIEMLTRGIAGAQLTRPEWQAQIDRWRTSFLSAAP